MPRKARVIRRVNGQFCGKARFYAFVNLACGSVEQREKREAAMRRFASVSPLHLTRLAVDRKPVPHQTKAEIKRHE
ncbi:hypothetical protein D9M70_417280 [compost metagenome]